MVQTRRSVGGKISAETSPQKEATGRAKQDKHSAPGKSFQAEQSKYVTVQSVHYKKTRSSSKPLTVVVSETL